MTPSDLIKRHEGYRAFVYDDASGLILKPGRMVKGSPTIGWGRDLISAGVSTDEANTLLDHDVAACIADLGAIFGDVFASADPARQAALIDMRYTLGPNRFRQFVQMIDAIKAGDWNAAADAALASKWAREEARIRARDDAELLRSCALP